MKSLNIILAPIEGEPYQVFIEIEDDFGHSYKAGTYTKGEKFDKIRITEDDLRDCRVEDF